MLKLASASSPVHVSNAHVGLKSVKPTKYTPGVQIGRQKLAVTLHRRFGSQTAHVRAGHQLLQELAQCLGFGVDVDLVFPLKLSPHGSELCLCALCWFDVVHDIDMYVVEYDHIRVDSLLPVSRLALHC